MLRKLRKVKKLTPSKRKNTEIMISNITKIYFRIVMFLFFTLAVVFSGYAPNKGPKLPDGFCKYGDVTATTGECMCHWQHKDGCTGSSCEYQMGLSFYHHSCKDCKCVQDPES
mmetsp:Transcript_34413/g.39162  ORF Transcript_34413/g.39162 Transcript_34413/m.39162 type:complete len:113 (+) Transcript_34413:165-503(+)